VAGKENREAFFGGRRSAKRSDIRARLLIPNLLERLLVMIFVDERPTHA
jgi:hypothetical protein